jgi:hypothetical protein
MNEREKILKELSETSPALMAIGKQMAYSLPDGYFDQFPVSLLGKIAGKVEYSVPEGYFDSLPNALLSKIRAIEASNTGVQDGEKELAEIAPILSGLSRRMPFTVPEGYFEQPGNFEPKRETPVISINRKPNVLRLSIAASVIIITGLFAWFFTNNNHDQNSRVASSNDSTISTDTNFAAALSRIEDTSIHTELNNNDFPDNTLSSLYYLSTDNIETALQDFSDEEIKSQLAETVVVKNKS